MIALALSRGTEPSIAVPRLAGPLRDCRRALQRWLLWCRARPVGRGMRQHDRAWVVLGASSHRQRCTVAMACCFRSGNPGGRRPRQRRRRAPGRYHCAGCDEVFCRAATARCATSLRFKAPSLGLEQPSPQLLRGVAMLTPDRDVARLVGRLGELVRSAEATIEAARLQRLRERPVDRGERWKKHPVGRRSAHSGRNPRRRLSSRMYG